MTTLDTIILILTIVCWVWQALLFLGAMLIVAGGRSARFGILPGVAALAGSIYLAVVLT